MSVTLPVLSIFTKVNAFLGFRRSLVAKPRLEILSLLLLLVRRRLFDHERAFWALYRFITFARDLTSLIPSGTFSHLILKPISPNGLIIRNPLALLTPSSLACVDAMEIEAEIRLCIVLT